MSSKTFGSLFAGIGGIDLGLERAGWECRWQVEIDPFCQRVLAAHWPDVPRYGDIRAIDWSIVDRVDLLAGGFPCQPISSAGKQLAQADDRWLWPEFARAIRGLRPRLVLVENVRNLLSVADGSAFAEVLGELAACGYDAEWDCIPASALGAPHQRDRLWLVAYPARLQQGRQEQWPIGERAGSGGQSVDVADANEIGAHRGGPRGARWTEPANCGGLVADAHQEGPQGHRGLHLYGDGAGERLAWARSRAIESQWLVEPDFRGVADGLSQGLDGGVSAGVGLRASNGAEAEVRSALRTLWGIVIAGLAPQERRSDGQLVRELASAVRLMPHVPSLGDEQATVATVADYVRDMRAALSSLGLVSDTSDSLAEAWIALSGEEADWAGLAADAGPWFSEWPDVPRVATKVPQRVDRLKALGNAVVPQIPEFIGRLLG